MKLIDKATVVADIERIEYETNYEPFTDEVLGKRDVCRKIREFLDTLEVKEVNELTAFDRGMAEEIIINLKRVEQDYRVNLTKEMEWVKNQV